MHSNKIGFGAMQKDAFFRTFKDRGHRYPIERVLSFLRVIPLQAGFDKLSSYGKLRENSLVEESNA